MGGASGHGCSGTHPSLPGSGTCRSAVPLRGRPPHKPCHSHPPVYRRITVQRATSFKTRLLRGTRLLRPHYAESRPPGGSPAPGATALHGTAGTASSGPFWGFWATRENNVQEGNWDVRQIRESKLSGPSRGKDSEGRFQDTQRSPLFSSGELVHVLFSPEKQKGIPKNSNVMCGKKRIQ